MRVKKDTIEGSIWSAEESKVLTFGLK